MVSDHEFLSKTIGLRPPSFWRWPEYVLTKFLALRLRGSMPDQVLLRCESCMKLFSTRFPCKCGGRMARRANGTTWDALKVWVMRR